MLAANTNQTPSVHSDPNRPILDSLFSLGHKNEFYETHTIYYSMGIQMIMWKQKRKQLHTCKLPFKIYKPHFQFELYLKGAGECKIDPKTGYPATMVPFQSGTWALNHFEKSKGFLDFYPFEQGLSLSIIIEPYSLMQNSPHLSRTLLSFLEENSDFEPPTIKMGSMNEPMFETTRQLLECPYTGPASQFFIEAKVLELIALQLAIATDEPASLKSREMDAEELAAINMARKILLVEINTPPSLEDLARQVGLNRNKLNRGFKKVFGVTVFEMLRAERLERAKTFLQDSHMSLAEIAQAVGYCAQSHFTSAFTAYFGKTPGQFRKEHSG